MDHILSSPPAPVAPSALAAHEPKQPSAKDVGEDVVHARTAASALPKPLFSISIIELLFLGVCQHLVGETYLFELQRGRKQMQNLPTCRQLTKAATSSSASHELLKARFEHFKSHLVKTFNALNRDQSGHGLLNL